MRLEGRCALITGAGSGIGRALAVEGAARGMKIALAGRRADKLEETRAMLAGEGHLVTPMDVTEAAGRGGAFARIAQEWKKLDVLVNNAGVVPGGPLMEMTDDDLNAALAVNLAAPIALTRDMLPLLRRSGAPHVVNVGSLLGHIPYPLFAAYSASKAGLEAFSTALRRELAPLGVRVTHAAPRATRTQAAKPFQALAEPFNMTFDKPENVATTIWNAVSREAKVVWPGRQERLFVLVQRLFPRLVDRSIAEQLARARRMARTPDKL